MKIEQTDAEFKPVVITLQSLNELKAVERAMHIVVNYTTPREAYEASVRGNNIPLFESVALITKIYKELFDLAWDDCEEAPND